MKLPMFNGVTLSGGNNYLIQLGTSSSYIAKLDDTY